MVQDKMRTMPQFIVPTIPESLRVSFHVFQNGPNVFTLQPPPKKESKSKRKEKASPLGTGCKAQGCHVLHSLEWRKGPDGEKSLCNACGLRFQRLIRQALKPVEEVIVLFGGDPSFKKAVEEILAETEKLKGMGGSSYLPCKKKTKTTAPSPSTSKLLTDSENNNNSKSSSGSSNNSDNNVSQDEQKKKGSPISSEIGETNGEYVLDAESIDDIETGLMEQIETGTDRSENDTS